jgi:hypothetical protein
LAFSLETHKARRVALYAHRAIAATACHVFRQLRLPPLPLRTLPHLWRPAARHRAAARHVAAAAPKFFATTPPLPTPPACRPHRPREPSRRGGEPQQLVAGGALVAALHRPPRRRSRPPCVVTSVIALRSKVGRAIRVWVALRGAFY